jgi:hypothetical protein
MLLDRKQVPWVATSAAVGAGAVAFYCVWRDAQTPGGLTGGSTVGLWYAVAGSALMIFAGLLAVRRKVPSWWWLGSRQFWLRGHIWLGLLGVVLILCHSGFRWGGPFTRVLWVVLGLTIGTGIFGLLVQQLLPRLLAQRFPDEVPYEQIPHVCQLMRQQADEAITKAWAINMEKSMALALNSQLGFGASADLQGFYEEHVRPFLQAGPLGSRLLANPLQAEERFAYFRDVPFLAGRKDAITLIENLCTKRRRLAGQERLHRWLHAWLLLHVPLSVLLLILGVAHAAMSLYY